jgi:hypothetical protein
MPDNKRFWEQRSTVKQSINARTYRCPVCNVVLFSVPETLPIPSEKTEVTCTNGHRVTVPKYDSKDIV